MLIAYTNERETIVCDHTVEADMLQEWFYNAQRNPDEYDRVALGTVAHITYSIHCSN
jgi:hypothetical protein